MSPTSNMLDPTTRRRWLQACGAGALAAAAAPALAQRPLLPEHITPEALRAVEKGLAALARLQSANGSFESQRDGATYPVAMASLAGMAFLSSGSTTTRGAHADRVRRVAGFVLAQSRPNGLIADARESGYSMYGHGFALLFLSCAYGMETRAEIRQEMAKKISAGILLTSRAQSRAGGWTYTPGSGDEGSVTITQMQGLRAAHNAGFTVPKSTIEKAIRYLEMCRTPDGGIRYSLASGNQTRTPISAAAIACLYSAGEYESPLAESCLKHVFGQFENGRDFSFGAGHDFYTNQYAAQAFYQAGDKYWNAYFPKIRDHLTQSQRDGLWNGDGVGQVYGTAIGLIILQLPYKFLPIYQR